MTRAESLMKRFAIGKKVVVSSTVPNTREWPGIREDMHQFFCGEELEILGHVMHPEDSSKLALILNTAEFGTQKDMLFSTDWLSLVSDEKMEVVLARVSQKRLYKKKEQTLTDQELRERLDKIFKITTKQREAPESQKQSEPAIQNEKVSKPVDFGWGAALGGALVSALGVAMAKQKLGKADGLSAKDAEPVSKEVEIVQEVGITV